MGIAKTITKYLDEKKYKYQIVEHKTVFTAWDKAQTEKVKPQEIAKTLVMKADNDHILALVPSNKKLDKAKLLKLANASRKKKGLKAYKKINFANEAWMKKNLPGRVGATAPFLGLTKCDIFMDNILAKNKKIQVGSGEYTASFLISVSQYLKIENPAKGSFSAKK